MQKEQNQVMVVSGYKYNTCILKSCNYTPVVVGKFGISLYGNTSVSLSLSRSSANSPRPEPQMIPTSGRIFVLRKRWSATNFTSSNVIASEERETDREVAVGVVSPSSSLVLATSPTSFLLSLLIRKERGRVEGKRRWEMVVKTYHRLPHTANTVIHSYTTDTHTLHS